MVQYIEQRQRGRNRRSGSVDECNMTSKALRQDPGSNEWSSQIDRSKGLSWG